MSDKPLTKEERYLISAEQKAGHDQADIAMVLSRNKSTIGRELNRNNGLLGYRPK